MHATKEKDGQLLTIEVQEKQLFSGIDLRILKLLADGEMYPKEISRELRLQEQKIYYHIRQLEKKGFVRLARKEERGGALAKIYELSSPAFLVRFGGFHETKRVPRSSGWEPFIRNGRLDAKIIVGSTEPHGPEKARSRDVAFAVDLGLFIGTFLSKIEPAVMEDKDARMQDLNTNLIIIGGPVTNKITKMVNSKLPVKFDAKKNIISKKKSYRSDDCGFVTHADNPFHPGKKLLVIAGKRYSGTRAAVLAFMKHFEEIQKKNFVVVEGIDHDGDGEIDDVKILE